MGNWLYVIILVVYIEFLILLKISMANAIQYEVLERKLPRSKDTDYSNTLQAAYRMQGDNIQRSHQMDVGSVHSAQENKSEIRTSSHTFHFEPKQFLIPGDRRSQLKSEETPAIKDLPMANIAPDQTRSFKNNLGKFRETPSSLIKRLCRVKTSKKEVCYQHGSSKCFCSGGLADCSGKPHVPNLSYAPKMPENITCLNFANNNVGHLDDSYFSNVTTFLVVDFSSNNLATISSETFERFTQLKYLILNGNPLTYKYIEMVLKFPPSFRLDINHLYLKEVPPNFFDPYRIIPTKQIYMDFSVMSTLNLIEFSKLQNLEILSLGNSSIENVISAPMFHLKVLYLNNNNISFFPVTCNSNRDTKNNLNYFEYQYSNLSRFSLKGLSEQIQNGSEEFESSSLFPVLMELDLRYNIIAGLPAPHEVCLPKLTTLQLESNNISEISSNAFVGLQSIKSLDLGKMNAGITKIGRAAFNISTLTSLYISKNRIIFDSEDISSKMFEGCSYVRTLSIDHNQLSDMTEVMFEELFNHTPSLMYLDLGSTAMKVIPVKGFSQLKKLERLFMYVNNIKEIPNGAFDRMLSLRYLYLDENKISTIAENAFSMETRRRLKSINLSKNPYLCDCSLLWFQSWLHEAGPKLFMDFKDYLCSNINSVPVQSYVLSKQACLFSRETYILFVVFLSIFMVLFIVFAILYRYRWNIRLMMYERRVPSREVMKLLAQERSRYDLFIVYCNDDRQWVETLLLPKLEKGWKLKACIHQRDFIAGGSIIDNVVESMNASRRILVVVSSGFAHSQWCNFELQMCQSFVITHDLPSLVVIILDKIERRDMRAAMLALYHSTCFLQWPSNSPYPREIELFWKRLQDSLATVINARLHTTTVKDVN